MRQDESLPATRVFEGIEVVAALLEVLPEYARYIVCILVDTGLRMSELHRIRWQDVDTKVSSLWAIRGVGGFILAV